MNRWMTAVLDLAGACAIIYGISLWSRPAAYVVAGLLLLLVSFARDGGDGS